MRNITVFENEEAVRLLDYFVSYREIINKTETLQVNLSTKT